MTLSARRLYGTVLASIHLLTLIFWQAFDFRWGLLERLSTPTQNPWSFIPQAYMDLLTATAVFWVGAYIFLAFLTPVLFLWKKIPLKGGLTVFALTLLVKLAIFFTSYDFMGNYHYMENLVMLGYLFSGGSLFFLRLMIVLFYVGAGLLKLNWEWISGSALLTETFLRNDLLIAACVYVIFLELILVWGLLAKNRRVRLWTLMQLFVFHVFSWHIVGFYYPSVMLLLLTVFWLKEESPIAPKKLSWSLWFYLGLFLLAQAYPFLLGKRASITGEGRLFALNMLDAKTQCLASYELRQKNGFIYLDNPLSYAIRLQCDPLIYFNYGKKLCADLRRDGGTISPEIRLNIFTKKSTEDQFTGVVRHQNICAEDLKYSVLGNSWIHADGPVKNPSSESSSENALQHWRGNPARTGQVVQNSFVPGPPRHIQTALHSRIHGAAKSSPLGTAPAWFIAGDNGWVRGFHHTDLRWQTYFPKSGYGFHGSPVVTDQNNLILGSYDGILHKLNGQNGQRLWAQKLGNAIGASPLLLEGAVYIPVENTTDSTFFALDARTGQIRWHTKTSSGLAHASLAYAAASDLLLGATNTGSVLAFNRRTGAEVWSIDLQEALIATPVVADGKMFVFSTAGTVAALEVASGKILWRKKLTTGGRSSPTYSEAADLMIVTDEEGTVYALHGRDGTRLWSFPGAHPHASSGVLIGALYWDQCGTQKLCARQITTGRLEYEFSLPGSFSSTPLVTPDFLLITLDGEAGFWLLPSAAKNRGSKSREKRPPPLRSDAPPAN